MRKTCCVILFVLLASASAFAQSGGYDSSAGSGSSGNSSSSSSSGSSSPSGGLSSSAEFGETIETPTFQGVEDVSNRGFIGSGVPDGFVGVDEVYESFAPSNSTTNRASTSSATRRTTSSATRRTTTNRSTANRSGTTSGTSVRAATTADFDYKPLQTSQRISAVQTHLKQIPGLQNETVSLQATPTGTVATLTGIVKTEKERRLAKQLLLLEPGIDRVENKLRVAE